MSERRIPRSTIPFPPIPERWNEDGKRFAMGLRGVLDQMQARLWQRALPVGIVVLTAENEKPFEFGKWESVQTGMTGIYGWKRVNP